MVLHFKPSSKNGKVVPYGGHHCDTKNNSRRCYRFERISKASEQLIDTREIKRRDRIVNENSAGSSTSIESNVVHVLISLSGRDDTNYSPWTVDSPVPGNRTGKSNIWMFRLSLPQCRASYSRNVDVASSTRFRKKRIIATDGS